ncbi:MAG: 50S ribosomal protein L37ae [Solirubrobacterales bacterium]|nr:50S ribosomal protein L37ae [Thermoplasmata archaeon]
MSKRTKKVGNTGWMGPRYGIRIRRRVLELDRSRVPSAACPHCSTVSVDRIASGVFECRRCGVKYASGAYLFSPAPPVTRSEKAEAASAASGSR